MALQDISQVKVGAIVAMNQQRIIGVDGDLPWHYPNDLKRFKRETLGAPIIMGRLTWLSLGEKPLPNRQNIVVSRQGVEHVESYDCTTKALNAAKQYAMDSQTQMPQPMVWIIGGGQLYQSMIDSIDFFDITLVPDVLDENQFEKVTKLVEFDSQVWQTGEWHKNIDDSRLSHQRVVRRIDSN